MTTTGSTIPAWLRSKLPYGLLGLLSLLYVALTMLTPIDSHARTYGLRVASLHWLQLTILLPIIGVWFIALWGSLRFKLYALRIAASKDGQALNQVANGLLLLVASLVLTSLAQSFLAIFVRDHNPRADMIVTHYIALILPLAAFAVIALGAQRLSALIHHQGIMRSQLGVFVLVAVMGIIYAALLVVDPNRQSSPNPAQISSYYLSDWLIILTLVLPYLVQWYLGLMAAALVLNYQHYALGVIYRQALVKLAAGMAAIIGALVLIQLLTALGPGLSHLGLGAILALIYVLILVYALGHVLVALGARRLSRIEEAGR
jgi:hypothetical protein